MYISSPLIFVWIGSELPSWARIALNIAVKNSGCEVILLTSKFNPDVICEQVRISDFYNPSNLQIKNSTSFRDGFWVKSLERYLVLNDFIRYKGIRSFFHAELDNLVFNIAPLDSIFSKFSNGLFLPKDNENRCIASLIYCNSSELLQDLSEFILNESNKYENDMEVLGEYSKINEQVRFLPNEAVLESSFITPDRYFNQVDLNGVFDAAAIGQFLFGIDPRNSIFPTFNRFLNENAGYDLNKVKFDISLDDCKATLNQLNLYNIHVHSKIFHKFLKPGYIERVTEKINSGKRSFISF